MRIDKEAIITTGFAVAMILLLWPKKKIRRNPKHLSVDNDYFEYVKQSKSGSMMQDARKKSG